MRAAAQLQQTGPATENLVSLLIDRARDPAKVGARHKRGGKWEKATWAQILERVKRVSAGLIALGLKPGERVAIFGATSLEWAISDLAVSAARGITVPIYASNTPDECRYILNNSESSYALVDDDVADGRQAGRLTRVRQRISECPSVRKVVIFDGQPQGDRELPLSEVVARGEQAHLANPAAFDERVAQIRTDDPMCFIYTSGTTGDPKGVILTHGNWGYEAKSLASASVMRPDDAVMLFLPLAHSFAQVVKAAWLGLGYEMVFAESAEKLLANLAETRPIILPSVPRVFEKVYNNVVATGVASPGLKGKLFRWALGLFDQYASAKMQGREYSSLSFTLARRLVFSKVRHTLDEKLGGSMRLFISGGAPLSRKIAYFFELLGLVVLEGYGLTETSAGATLNPPEKPKVGTVGPPLPGGAEVKIAPDGEILIRGPHIMKGYYKNPEATAEVLEPDGWFHSGDIGELDADGYVRITDRKKDIIVTAGGKNVAPQNLENQLKTHPLISSAMVYGDKRKYLSVLICVAEDSARKLLADKGVQVSGYAELAARQEIQQAVQKIIDAVNAEQPPYMTLKRFHLMDHDFTQESGELTPTLKVKRKVCTQRYKAILDALYDGETFD